MFDCSSDPPCLSCVDSRGISLRRRRSRCNKVEMAQGPTTCDRVVAHTWLPNTNTPGACCWVVAVGVAQSYTTSLSLSFRPRAVRIPTANHESATLSRKNFIQGFPINHNTTKLLTTENLKRKKHKSCDVDH